MNEYELTKFVHELADKHGLRKPKVVLNNRMTRNVGKYLKHKNFPNNDELHISKKFMEVNNWDNNILTHVVLHELSHQNAMNHGSEFERECLKLGVEYSTAIPIPCKKVPRKYVATCPNCGTIHYKNRISKKYRESCGKCSTHFDTRCLLTYELNRTNV